MHFKDFYVPNLLVLSCILLTVIDFKLILNFYYTFYSSDIEACQGLHLFPQCDVM